MSEILSPNPKKLKDNIFHYLQLKMPKIDSQDPDCDSEGG